MSFVAQRLAVLWARMISKTTAHVIWHVAYSVGQPIHCSHQSLINYTPSHPALIHPQTRTSPTKPPAHPHTISLITITHSFTHTSPIQSHDVTLSHTHHSPSHLLTQTLSHLSLSPTHLPTHHHHIQICLELYVNRHLHVKSCCVKTISIHQNLSSYTSAHISTKSPMVLYQLSILPAGRMHGAWYLRPGRRHAVRLG